MKTKQAIIIPSLLIMVCTVAFSQKDSSGIYFKASDYIHHKLSLAINCKTQKHKINDEMIFHPKEISVKHNGTAYKYPKDSVYAIKYCDGSIVRIYDNSEYPLINPDEAIMIYKMISGSAGKGGSSTTNYYFSKDANSKLSDLTILNIKKAFPDNHKFHDALDAEFKSNDELAQYDSFHKVYKINRLYSNSISH